MANPEKSRWIPRDKEELVETYAVKTRQNPSDLVPSLVRGLFSKTYKKVVDNVRNGSTSSTRDLLLNCGDGRTIQPAINFVRQQSGSTSNNDWIPPDVMTRPGIVGTLSKGKTKDNRVAIADFFTYTKVNKTKAIYVAGHGGCKGNPVLENQQLEDIKKTTEKVQGWVNTYLPGQKISIHSVFMREISPDKFKGELVPDSQNQSSNLENSVTIFDDARASQN